MANGSIRQMRRRHFGRLTTPIINSVEWTDNGIQLLRGQNKKRWILVLGQDQLTPKSFYYAKEFEQFEVFTYFLSRDKSGVSQENIEKHRLYATVIPKNLLRHWWIFLRLIWRLRPCHMEFFTGTRPWTLVFYTLTGRLLGIPIVTWIRGRKGIDHKSHHPIRRFANRLLFRCSAMILLRELHMEQTIRQYGGAAPQHLRLCHNAVPVPPEPLSKREPLVLFLNRFVPWRNAALIIEAAPLILQKVPEAHFELVGATSHLSDYKAVPDKAEDQLQGCIRSLSLFEQVRILPFTNRPSEYFRRASVFVLPADIVFCNNSLLEAMAMGVVPVVADVEGADFIVEDGVSGYVVERDANKIAEKIIAVLRDEELRKQMAQAARARVKSYFNSVHTGRSLLEFYKNEVW